MKNYLFTIVSTIFFFITGYSQDSCYDILRNGVRDTYRYSNSYHSQLAKAIDISKMSFSEFKSNWKGGVSIPYYGVTYKGNIDESKFNQIQKELRTKVRENKLVKYENDVFVLAANKDIINAWKDCMNDYPGKFESYITPTDVKEGFYNYSYHYTYFNAGNPKFKGYTGHPNLEVIDSKGYLNEGKSMRAGVESIVRLKLINPKKSAILTVHSDRGDREFFIPAYKVGEPIPSLPKGLAKDPYYLDDNLLIEHNNIHGGLQFNKVYWTNTAPELNGTKYRWCIGMHAPKSGTGVAKFTIPEGAKYFNVYFFLADGCKTYNEVKGKVLIDGRLAGERTLNDGNRGKGVSIEIRKNDQIITLIVDAGRNNTCDHSTWGNAHFSETKSY